MISVNLEGVATRVPLWLRWLLPWVIVAAAFLVFLPALENDFVNWDDDKVLVNNNNFRGFGADQLRWMFTAYNMGHYHPLTWISFALDYRIWGIDEAFGFHLTNMVLHALNAVFFYFLALCILRLAMPERHERDELALYIGAATAAIVFGVHPLRVESVAWATERRDVLSTFFLIPCVLCYIRYASGPVRRWGFYVASVGLLLLSLFSKAWGITLPAVLLVLDLYPLRRIGTRVKDLLSPDAVRLLIEKIPFLVLAAYAAYKAADAQAASIDTMLTLERYGMTERIIQAFYGIAFYVHRTLLPVGLAPLYEIPVEMNPFAPRFVAGIVAVVSGTTMLILFRRRWPAGLALLAFYVITVSPVLGLAQSGPQLAADRYSYISCLGWALLAGAGILWCVRARFEGRLRPGALGMIVTGTVIVVAVLTVLTWQQTKVWRTSQTLWEHNLAVRPDTYTAHYNLGVYLANHKRYDRAIEEFSEVIRIQPRHYEAHCDLGRVLQMKGRNREAIEHYDEALRLKPDLPDINDRLGSTHSALGIELAQQGKIDESIEHFTEAVRLQPTIAEVKFNLGLVLAKANRIVEAEKYFSDALQLDPNHVQAHTSLAAVFNMQGKTDAAMTHYLEAVRIKPDSADSHRNLGKLFAQHGEIQKAVDHYREALKYAPNYPSAANELAWLLATSNDARIRDSTEAIRLATQACQAMAFREPRFQDTLAAAYAEAGRFDKAIEIIHRIIEITTMLNLEEYTKELGRRLLLYQEGRSYRDTQPDSDTPRKAEERSSSSLTF